MGWGVTPSPTPLSLIRQKVNDTIGVNRDRTRFENSVDKRCCLLRNVVDLCAHIDTNGQANSIFVVSKVVAGVARDRDTAFITCLNHVEREAGKALQLTGQKRAQDIEVATGKLS